MSKRGLAIHGGNAVKHLALILFSLLVLVPILLMITTSLKSQGDSFTSVSVIPTSFHFENYVKIWSETKLGRMILNSLAVTVVSTALLVALATLAGFGFARTRFGGKAALYLVFLLGLMLPGASLIVALYRIIAKVKLMNTYFALIGPYTALGLPFAIMNIRNYFQTIPFELDEAAVMDGASPFWVYYRVCLPLAKPAVATVVIFQAMFAWNEMLFALLFMTRDYMRTAPLAWLTYQMRYGLQMEKAFAVLATISVPVLILYLVLQRQFIKGLTAGAIKA